MGYIEFRDVYLYWMIHKITMNCPAPQSQDRNKIICFGIEPTILSVG